MPGQIRQENNLAVLDQKRLSNISPAYKLNVAKSAHAAKMVNIHLRSKWEYAHSG